MLYLPMNHPLYWYPYDVAGSIELLMTYVKDLEQQSDRLVAQFEAELETVEVGGDHPDDPGQLVSVYQGLDDMAWDLRDVFRVYFPNLQRRSTLITLFSFLEHELNKLCCRFQEAENLNISYQDLAGSGIQRAKSYLTKVALLNVDHGTQEWSELKNVQVLRNSFAHLDGRIIDERGRTRGNLKQYVDASPFLKGTEEVLVMPGYLLHVLTAFDRYFRQLHSAVKVRYDA